jgi:hypothetical protein
MANNGHVRTLVAEELRRSGIGRDTFYQQFPSQED